MHGANLWRQRSGCRRVVLLQEVVNKAEPAALSNAQGRIAMDPLAERLHKSKVSALQALTLISKRCRDGIISEVSA